MTKQRLFIDMDGVLVDFKSGLDWAQNDAHRTMSESLYEDCWEDYPGIFAHMTPLDGALDAFRHFTSDSRLDVHILSTAPWNNCEAWCHKVMWVQKYLGEAGKKRLTLTHHKNIAHGRWLIDDRIKHGVDLFGGEHIHFGTKKFPDWNTVVKYIDNALV